MQVNTYAAMYIRQLTELHLDEARIAYISRDTFEIKEFPVPVRPLAFVADDWERLFDSWRRQDLPVFSPSWQCDYCSYRRHCA